MGKASKADVEKAFTAGFKDENIDLDPSAELEENTPAVKNTAGSNKDLENEPRSQEEAKADEVDEWAGYPPAMKARFENMAANLEKVTNIANSASGRANKLQSDMDKGLAAAKPEKKQQLTSEQLLEAMTDRGARDVLREDFGEFAAALDEIDQSVSTSVGTAMDKLRVEMREEARNINAAATQDFEIKRSLDNKHPGWETTVQDKEFKKWAYEGGPSEQESSYYDSLVAHASQAAPEDSAALYDTASNYFNSMVENNPVWAREKGSLYGDPSGKAAISLLDLYKKDKTPEPTLETPAPAARREPSIFEENLTPTSGRARQQPAASADDVEKAFSEGFRS